MGNYAHDACTFHERRRASKDWDCRPRGGLFAFWRVPQIDTVRCRGRDHARADAVLVANAGAHGRGFDQRHD
jgi:hypothetical protein